MESVDQKLGPCGGDGGVGDMDPIDTVVRINSIVIRHGECIHAFVVRYQRSGKKESSIREWGKPAGKHTEFALQPNERITTVRGHYGFWDETVVVRSLKLETNFHTYGPFGMEEGTSFEFLAPGGQIIGFHARHSWYLNAIGVYVEASFAPRLRGLQHKELTLHLYTRQNFAEPSITQARIGGPSQQHTNHVSYTTTAYDWPLLDGHGRSAKVVARARGINAQCQSDSYEYYCSFNIVFDDKWKGSSLQVSGPWIYNSSLQELAIVGGTGQFQLAQGILYAKQLGHKDNVRINKLFIHAFYCPLERP